MKVAPFAPQLLIDYTYFCNRFGPLPFGDFVAMWHAADALMQATADAGFEPYEVPHLLVTADNPRMALIRAMVACIRPNIGHAAARRKCATVAKRWRAVGAGSAHHRRSTLESRGRVRRMSGCGYGQNATSAEGRIEPSNDGAGVVHLSKVV